MSAKPKRWRAKGRPARARTSLPEYAEREKMVIAANNAVDAIWDYANGDPVKALNVIANVLCKMFRTIEPASVQEEFIEVFIHRLRAELGHNQ